MHGIPFVVKDSYNVAGLPTSVGVAAWKDLYPIDDAFVVQEMRRAGAILLGKTNLDTFALNDKGVSDAFGAVTNPYGAKAVGGSSAGSAVAVAAHLAAIAFGGDTAGSLRMPASRNNVVSLRPTLGLISTAGTAPGDPLFDVVGPMTRTVSDLSRVLDIVVVTDANNPLSTYLPSLQKQRPKSYVPMTATRSLNGVSFAVPRRLVSESTVGAKFLTPGRPILQAFANIRDQLTKAGARIIDVDVPADDVLDDTWYYDQDVSQAGEVAKPIYDARTALVNIRVFASEFEKFCSGWCGDPANRMLDVAALFDYPELMQSVRVLREGTALSVNSAPVAASIRTAAAIADGPLFGQWMVEKHVDALLFPASSDADSDTRFGMNYLSELGAPGLFVPAGYVKSSTAGAAQPLGVALVAGRFQEQKLIEIGAAVEAALHARVNPDSTPALEGESIELDGPSVPVRQRSEKDPPRLSIDAVDLTESGGLLISGVATDHSEVPVVQLYINGAKAGVTRNHEHWIARLEPPEGGDALCVADGRAIAFAKDIFGNTAAVWKTLTPAKSCTHPSH